MKDVGRWLAKNHSAMVNDLAELVAIPSVSTDRQHPREIQQSAKLVFQLMRRAGLRDVQTFAPKNANPFVFGQWLGAPGKPTVLLYAHHDVQPPGNSKDWISPPWKLTRRRGRLYGRGSADDKGAIVAQLGAIAAMLKTRGALPVNVKVIVEGEEEIGSPALLPFCESYRKQIEADVIVVCDTDNIDVGVPSITYSLRGGFHMIVEVETAEAARHSGFAGGLVADAAIALNVVLSRLYWDRGKVAVPHFYDGIVPMTEQQRRWMNELPINEAKLRKEFGVL